jgi:peptidoglycan/xylan/chitin deacetylase (PgdA/CDA1 family)
MSSDSKRSFAARLGIGISNDEAILDRLKDTEHAQRKIYEAELRERTPDFTPAEEEHQRYDLLTWQDLREMDRAIIDIGGHSTNHEILTRLDAVALENEVGECKRLLESQLQRPVRHFCYPNGDFNDTVRSCVSRYFETAVTTEQALLTQKTSLLEMPRVPAADNLDDFVWRMHRPTG